MSKQCDYCGFKDPMPFTCKFCGNSYCYNHRLPESHNCTGLALFKERVQSSGGLYHYKPDLTVKNRKNPVLNSLKNAVSIVKSNYSLTILVIVIISFLLQNIPGYFSYLALYPLGIITRPWTVVTHMFLHSGPIHLLFNMMFLFFFGPELERRIGGKRFLIVFFLSGIVAAIGYSLWSVFILRSAAPAVGASGALFGIFACLAVIAPDIEVYIYIIPMKITHALIFFALLDIILGSTFMVTGSTVDMVARSAHLSGIIAGLVMGRQIKGSGRHDWY